MPCQGSLLLQCPQVHLEEDIAILQMQHRHSYRISPSQYLKGRFQREQDRQYTFQASYNVPNRSCRVTNRCHLHVSVHLQRSLHLELPAAHLQLSTVQSAKSTFVSYKQMKAYKAEMSYIQFWLILLCICSRSFIKQSSNEPWRFGKPWHHGYVALTHILAVRVPGGVKNGVKDPFSSNDSMPSAKASHFFLEWLAFSCIAMKTLHY